MISGSSAAASDPPFRAESAFLKVLLGQPALETKQRIE